ncbi:MAG: ankyrin repeat domain-containing protein [Spirochaetales bacterium]|nr:ankyrin repeat domain-containing protein [Spirochaetales bacterium]
MKLKAALILVFFCFGFSVYSDDNHYDVFNIIEKYSPLLKEDSNNWTTVHCVAAEGSAGEMEILLESADLIDEVDAFGNSPVMISALYGNIGAFRVLIENGCRLDILNRRGGSCASYLGYFNDEDIDEALALIDEYSDIDIPTSGEMSLLHYAVHGGNYGLTAKILGYGVDVNREDSRGSMRPVDMARFISFQYTDVVDISDGDIELENMLVDLLLDNGSRNKSFIPMSIGAFGNFFFNIYIAIDSLLDDGPSMDEVNRGEYYTYKEVNGSLNPVIGIEAVGKMFEDAGLNVELKLHKQNFKQIIDECNDSEDLYLIMANMSGHPYIKNHWVLITTRYQTGSYQDFLKVYESSSLFAPLFYRVDDIGMMISIKVNN